MYHHTTFGLLIQLLFGLIECSHLEKCPNGRGYNSLECCDYFCSSAILNTTENCSHKTSQLSTLTYKSLYLTNGTWQQVLCQPLSKLLNSCITETVTPNRIVKLINQSIYISVYDLELPFDSFVYNELGEIEFCKPLLNLAIVHVIGMASSIASLLLTLTLAFTVDSFNKQSNYPFLCHLFMLCLAYCVTLLKNLIPSIYSHYACPLLPLIQQFSFLSSFFWNNVQAFIVHSAFSHMSAPKINSRLSKFQYFKYGMCGWGIALVITLFTLVMELSGVSRLNPSFVQNCWFPIEEKATSFLYYYGPMALSLTFNLILFVSIFIRVKKVMNQVAAVNKKAIKQLYFMVVKLTVILGFCWITKMVIYGGGFIGRFWLYLDVIPAFQGVLILVVYLLNVECCYLFLEKCKYLVGGNFKQNNVNTPTVSSSNL